MATFQLIREIREMTEAEARQRHPAGKGYIPKVAILERLRLVMQENYWMYGAPSQEAPNRVERWDLRSMLDYAVLTCQGCSFHPSYPTFYLWRNAVMQLIMEMAEVGNYGEWRFWETEKERTGQDLVSIVARVLLAEKAREAKEKETKK